MTQEQQPPQPKTVPVTRTTDQLEPTVTIPQALLDELVQVCGYYRAQVNGFFQGETPENHPDINAVCYLRDEATRIEAQARAFLGHQQQPFQRYEQLLRETAALRHPESERTPELQERIEAAIRRRVAEFTQERQAQQQQQQQAQQLPDPARQKGQGRGRGIEQSL